MLSGLAPQGHGLPSPHGPTPRPRRLAWFELPRRVFAVDVPECPRCGARMRLLAAIHPPAADGGALGRGPPHSGCPAPRVEVGSGIDPRRAGTARAAPRPA
jgi:hypothetical protein